MQFMKNLGLWMPCFLMLGALSSRTLSRVPACRWSKKIKHQKKQNLNSSSGGMWWNDWTRRGLETSCGFYWFILSVFFFHSIYSFPCSLIKGDYKVPTRSKRVECNELFQIISCTGLLGRFGCNLPPKLSILVKTDNVIVKCSIEILLVWMCSIKHGWNNLTHCFLLK